MDIIVQTVEAHAKNNISLPCDCPICNIDRMGNEMDALTKATLSKINS